MWVIDPLLPPSGGLKVFVIVWFLRLKSLGFWSMWVNTVKYLGEDWDLKYIWTRPQVCQLPDTFVWIPFFNMFYLPPVWPSLWSYGPLLPELWTARVDHHRWKSSLTLNCQGPVFKSYPLSPVQLWMVGVESHASPHEQCSCWWYWKVGGSVRGGWKLKQLF